MVAAVVLAGCGTTTQTAPPGGSTIPADTIPATQASTTPGAPPVDPATIKREAFKTCSQTPPDELQSRYNAPSSNPVDIADAYARTFPTSERVPVAEGCYEAIVQQLGGSNGGSTGP